MTQGYTFGINLSFAVKRWPEPEAWAAIVREKMGLEWVQFSFDLLDPWWPAPERDALAQRVRRATEAQGIKIHSAFVGLAAYTYNSLLHPLEEGRRAAREWWQRAIDLGAALGAKAVGGPLGGLSVNEFGDAACVQARYRALLEDIVRLSEHAKRAGLEMLLVEPTPLTREFPHTPEQAREMMEVLRSQVAVPIGYALDVGHALYRPLYGARAQLEEWLKPPLGEAIALFHLQNTDFQSDSHWGWPDERGRFDVWQFAQTLRTHNLADRPIFLEVFYAFEAADEFVLSNIVSSVQHCKAALA
ncbi:MAG: sugar phosphate isomerase/epimerase [Thermoflexales bacterium]|nr:sugar phosphate isomerase/epimerase [Thermoflexales bacterium]MDW8292709.1 TIM barrel protein [Anaerolineae bacterium]